jgi:hypothetical protein
MKPKKLGYTIATNVPNPDDYDYQAQKEVKVEGYRGQICKIISEMLDNPDDCGIYPTTKCFNQLEELISQALKAHTSRIVGIVEKLPKYDLSKSGVGGNYYLRLNDILKAIKEES